MINVTEKVKQIDDTIRRIDAVIDNNDNQAAHELCKEIIGIYGTEIEAILNMLDMSVWHFDEKPIDETCNCPVCRRYTRAYIRHLLVRDEMLGMRFCVLHNLAFYNNMMKEIREAIENNSFKDYKKRKLEMVDPKKTD